MHYLILLAAQEDKLAEQTVESLTNILKAGVIGIAVFAIFALIIGIYFGGKIINRLLDIFNRVSAALEKLSDQAEAQNTLIGELAVSMKDSKESSDKMVRQIRINTKVTKDFFSAELSRLEILTRGFTSAEAFFRTRIREVEALIRQAHTETLTAIAALTPKQQTTIVIPPPAATEKPDLLEDKKETGDTS